MASQRQPKFTSGRLESVVNVCHLDVLRVLTRMDLSHADRVAVLSVLVKTFERLRDKAAVNALYDDGVSAAELGRRMGVSRSYAARHIKALHRAPRP